MDPTLLAYIGPGLAEGLAAIGTSLGIEAAISAGTPVIAEDPSQRGKIFALAFFPMTQTLIYGMVYMFVMYMIVLPSLLSAHNGMIPFDKAGAVFGISLFVGFAELFSAYMQGRACASTAANLIKTRGGIMGTGIVLASYEELVGILGMVFGLAMVFLIVG